MKYQNSIATKVNFRQMLTAMVFSILLIMPYVVMAENNMKFLSSDIIKKLKYSIYEVVVPKVENEQLKYAKELPFDKLSFKERTEKYFSIGTAFFLNDKELMTAAHVLNLQYFTLLKDFYIRDSDGNVYKIEKIKKFSSRRDMTIIELESYPEKTIPLVFSEKVDIGDTVFSVGNAQGEGISFRAGQVASFTPENEYGEWKDIRFTSPASPGNSGGPLLDVNGEVVGLIIQKNSSENYNVAVPISEMKKLTNTADFFIRNISINLNDKQNNYSMDWSENFELPENLDKLSEKAQSSLNLFYTQVSEGAYKKYEDEYFPKGQRFRAYLRNQAYVRQFGVLNSDANFNSWSVKNHSSRTISINEDQDITISKSDLSTFHVIIDKPKDMPLNDFMASPKVVMDNLLLEFPLSRNVAVERIKVSSLGEPEKSEIWEDTLGRKWVSTLWYLPYMNHYLYSHCLPYPNGVICNVDIKEVWTLYTGYLELMKENLNEVIIGYEGEVYDWIEYLSLPVKYLPNTFKGNDMKLDDNRFQIALNDFEFTFTSDEISDKSSIHLHFGFSNDSLIAEDLLLFELFPKKGVDAHYRVQKYFSPSKFSSDRYKSKWDEVAEKTGDFSGKVITDNRNKVINKVMSNAERKITLIDGKEISRKTVLACYFKFSDESADKKCDNFVSSVVF